MRNANIEKNLNKWSESTASQFGGLGNEILQPDCRHETAVVLYKNFALCNITSLLSFQNIKLCSRQRKQKLCVKKTCVCKLCYVLLHKGGV